MASSTLAAAFAVFIHVAPGAPPELEAAAVRSCEVALGAGQCRLADPAAPASVWHATVASADEDSVRVELRRSDDEGARVVRDLAFAPEDPPRERWASTGVLIAALVVAEDRKEGEARRPDDPASAPAEAAPEPPSTAIRQAPPRPAPRILRIDLRALVARRLAVGSPEIGAEAGVSGLPGGGPWFAGAALVAAGRAGREPGVFWSSFAVLGGVRIGGHEARLAAEVRAAGVAEYWRLSASEGERSEGGDAIRFGGALGVDGLWAIYPEWILSLGVEARVVAPRLRIDVGGALAERIPGHGALVLLGLRAIP